MGIQMGVRWTPNGVSLSPYLSLSLSLSLCLSLSLSLCLGLSLSLCLGLSLSLSPSEPVPGPKRNLTIKSKPVTGPIRVRGRVMVRGGLCPNHSH